MDYFLHLKPQATAFAEDRDIADNLWSLRPRKLTLDWFPIASGRLAVLQVKVAYLCASPVEGVHIDCKLHPDLYRGYIIHQLQRVL